MKYKIGIITHYLFNRKRIYNLYIIISVIIRVYNSKQLFINCLYHKLLLKYLNGTINIATVKWRHISEVVELRLEEM